MIDKQKPATSNAEKPAAKRWLGVGGVKGELPDETSMIRITAAHFCAGVVLGRTDAVVRGAPILAYMVGWTRARVLGYAARKRWKVEELLGQNGQGRA